MANTFKFGNGNWATKEGSALAYNDENNNFKPLPFDFTRASSATRVNKDGLIEVVGSNEPRIDFLNDTDGALLLEPSRTNLIEYSEDFGNSFWTKSNATVISNNVISPNGTLNASSITFGSSGYLLESVTTTKTIGSSETISVFSKTDIIGTFLKYGGGTASGTDVENKESFGNGWYRYSVTRTFTEAETAQTQIIISSSDVGLNIVIYGAQLEAGSYATSYIPTQGSSVTRVADACNGAGNDQVFNASEGILFVEMAALDRQKSLFELISLSDGTTTNRMYLGFSSGTNKLRWLYGDNVFTGDTTSIETTNNNKIAFKFKDNDFAIWVNGVEIDSQLSGSTFSSNTFNTMGFGGVKAPIIAMDNKISFISGFTFTAISTVNIMGIFQAALVGLVGGFFGLLGKELYYYLKGKINERKST
jgi:hypothetical protein